MNQKKKKLAIVGSRNFDDYAMLNEKLTPYKNIVELVVSGGAKGADSLGEKWAKENNIPVKIFHPDWKKYGRAAGPIRNKEIINNADVVIAFWDGKSSGTKSSIELAKKAGKKVEVVLFKKE
jgi:predicted Rossmann fold nucleotide-binding protein DprA/Smf involved in DNA uptake